MSASDQSTTKRPVAENQHNTERANANIPQETVRFETITIEATSSPADPVQQLDSRELRIRTGETLGKTLERELGVSNLSYGPGVGQPVIRGMSGPRVRIMQNGIGAHDLSALSPDLAIAFETMLADSVTVLRGPATLRYGGNAIGGMVNIEHGRIPEKIPLNGTAGRMDFRYDHNSADKAGMIGFDAGKGMFAIHVDYFHRASNNTHIPGAALDEAAIRQQFQVEPSTNSAKVIQNSHSSSQGGSVGISMIGKHGHIGGSYHEMVRNYGIPPGVPGHTETGSTEQEAIRIDMSQRRYDLDGLWKTYWASLPSIKAKLSYIDYDHKDFDKSVTDRSASLTRFKNSVWESRLEMNHQRGEWLDGTFGMQWQNRSFAATGIETFTPAANIDSLGFFITETVFITERLDFEVGARIEHQTTTPKSNEIKLAGISAALPLPNALNYLTYSLAASLNYEILPKTSLYLNWQRAQRAPDVQELFASGPHFATRSFEIGRLNLDAEQTNHYELGLRFNGNQVSMQANGYYKSIQDFIYLENQGVFFNLAPDPPRFQLACADLRSCLPVFGYQANTANFAGYEAQITAHPRLGLPISPYLTLFSDYVRGWFQNEALGDVPRLPPLRFGGEIGFQWAQWRGALRYTHALQQNKPGNLETNTPRYDRLDLDLSYDWKMSDYRKILFFAKLSNMTNTTIRNSTSFLRNFAPEAGFSALAGMSATF
ncbi:TonB-dependent receptor [Nitrosomonas aestuarii]|uniref:TonB-dependent receptor n=1 Tax=Nitrosomonas aestuarii TaxID=52441 RepID=UPI000D31F087|nr:TonB-dependent receptor [Nitrosomonas aestuarii]PTN12145.1 iron complex outermembrane receptor protein [Nitrosomonas aestuarii]